MVSVYIYLTKKKKTLQIHNSFYYIDICIFTRFTQHTRARAHTDINPNPYRVFLILSPSDSVVIIVIVIAVGGERTIFKQVHFDGQDPVLDPSATFALSLIHI